MLTAGDRFAHKKLKYIYSIDCITSVKLNYMFKKRENKNFKIVA